MLLRAVDAGDLPVRDVAHEYMLERVLGLALDGAAPRALHELFLAEDVELLLSSTQRTEPEDLADDCGVLQQRLLLRRQRVETRRDDPLHRLRQPAVALSLREHACKLLRVQWI